jgi:hypothetical protein
MSNAAWQWGVIAVLVLASALYAIAHLAPGPWRATRRVIAARVLAGAHGGWRRWLAERLAPASGAAGGCSGCDQCEAPAAPRPRTRRSG